MKASKGTSKSNCWKSEMKGKNLKNSPEEKGTLLTEEKRWGWEQISHWKCCKQEDGGAMSLKHWEKTVISLKFYIRKKSLSKNVLLSFNNVLWNL